MDRQRDGQRRRPLRVHPHVSRRRQQQPAALHRSRRPPARRTITAPIKPIVETLDAEYTPIGNYQSRVYVRSRQGRAEPPHHRDRSRTRRARRRGRSWCPSSRTRSRTRALVGGRIVVHSLVDVQSRLQLFALDGTPRSGDSRCRASARSPNSTGAPDDYDVWFTFSSPLVAGHGVSLRSRIAVADAVRGAAAADRRVAVRDARDVRDLEGRHARAVLPDQQERAAAGRPQPDDALRIRRLLDQRAARLSLRCAGVARAGRRVRHR